jgi:hypothetical protein
LTELAIAISKVAATIAALMAIMLMIAAAPFAFFGAVFAGWMFWIYLVVIVGGIFGAPMMLFVLFRPGKKLRPALVFIGLIAANIITFRGLYA